MDRGYIDLERLYRFHAQLGPFLRRAHENQRPGSEFNKQWSVVALDAGSADPENWFTSNVK
jgi:hypothetical protein